jgi:hypothetical protein
MKKNLVILTLVAAFTLASFGFAGAGTAMRISVPFDFYAGNEQLPAGEYTFAMGSESSTVTVRAKEGTGICILLAKSGTDTAADRLLFNKYGGKHFLSGVSILGVKADVKMVKLEKELRAQFQREQNAVLFAQK